jgi:ParB family chromosome partitioning protein
MTMRVAVLALAAIVPPKVALRTVDKEDSKGVYKGLVESIKESGVINAIAVKEAKIKDEQTGVERDMYQIIDGLQRYCASVDAGLTEIPVQILDADEAEALELQIEGNVHKIETKPIQYSKQLLKILAAHPERTVKIQAARLAKSEGWLKDKLRLQKLVPEAQTLVDDGKIPLSSAYILAKLDDDEQDEWLEKAQTLPPDQFMPQVANRINELKKLHKDDPKPERKPTPLIRKKGEILEMFGNLPAEPKDDKQSGFKSALEWVVQMDESSIAAWHAKEAEELAKREARKAEKAKEKANKKSELPSIDDLLK